MSIFIVSMPVAGLMDSPPESKVIPLPTRARNPSASPGGRQVISTNRGGCVEPRLTPRSPPSPASAISSRSQTAISSAAPSVPSSPDAIARAAAASFSGVNDPPGSLTRSRAKHTAPATVVPSFSASRTSRPRPRTESFRRELGSGSLLKAS